MLEQENTGATPVAENKHMNPKRLDLKYFYGNETENTTFFMTPKLLLRNRELAKLSAEAKILYTLLLDRTKLSTKYGMKDEEGRIYVYYTIEEASYELHKSDKTTIKIFQELDTIKGIGLIERVKRGQGKADIIYVKSLATLPSDFPTFREQKRVVESPLPYVDQAHRHLTYDYPTTFDYPEDYPCQPVASQEQHFGTAFEEQNSKTMPTPPNIPVSQTLPPATYSGTSNATSQGGAISQAPYEPVVKPPENSRNTSHDTGKTAPSYEQNKVELAPKTPRFCDNSLQNNVDNSCYQTNHRTEVQVCNDVTYNARNEVSTGANMKIVHGNNTDVTNTERNKNELKKPTFHPNPPEEKETIPHPLSDENLMGRYGMGWEGLDTRGKYLVMEEMVNELVDCNLNVNRKELERLFYVFNNNKEQLGVYLDVLLNMEEAKEQSKYYEELSIDRFRFNTLVLYRQALLKMLTTDVTSTKKYGAIKYWQVIEAVVSHLDYQDKEFKNGVILGDIVNCTIENYIESSNASQNPIMHKIPYMQSTIWTTLQEGCIKTQADFGRFAANMGIW